MLTFHISAKAQNQFKVLATKKTSPMQKEINEGGEDGYSFVGVTVGKTLMGGSEIVIIMRRDVTP